MSVVQLVHLLALQILPPAQSAREQQFPGRHPPAQQVWPVAHWVALVQALHVLLRQTLPPEQSAPEQQSPARQPPEQQARSLKHLPLRLYAAALGWHTRSPRQLTAASRLGSAY